MTHKPQDNKLSHGILVGKSITVSGKGQTGNSMHRNDFDFEDE